MTLAMVGKKKKGIKEKKEKALIKLYKTIHSNISAFPHQEWTLSGFVFVVIADAL